MTRPLLTEYLHNTICIMPTDFKFVFKIKPTTTISKKTQHYQLAPPTRTQLRPEQQPEIAEQSTEVNHVRAEIATKKYYRRSDKKSQN